MTERIYYRDPGTTEFDAVITASCKEGERFVTLLDRSAFYPTSGGQLFDTGSLNGIAVIDVTETPEGEVAHVSSEPVGAVGDRVSGRVDARRRRMHRQQHTAQHILSQAFVELYGFATVSVHLGEEYGAIELGVDSVTPEQLKSVEERAVDVIFADYPTEILFLERAEALRLPLRRVPTREGVIRIIKIDDFDYSACGGTHCDRTGQVGLLRIIGVDKMRGNALVNFLAGEQARADYAARYEVTRTLGQALTCHFTDLPDGLVRLETDNRELRFEIGRLQKEVLPSQARELAAGAVKVGSRGLLVAPVSGMDSKLAGQLAVLVAGEIHGLAALLVEERLILASAPDSGLHAGNILKQLAIETGLRGGGGPTQAQAGGADLARLDTYRAILERLLREM